MESVSRYGVPAPKKKNTGLKIAVSVLIVLIAAVCIVVGLAFSDPYKGSGLDDVSPSNNLARTMTESLVTGKENRFSMGDVNAYLSYVFRKDVQGKQSGNVQIQAVAVAKASGDSADVYIPFLYQGKRLGLLLNVTPSLDTASQKLLYRVNSARVGRLPVPTSWVLKKAEKHLPAGFWLDGTTVVSKAPALSVSALGVTASAGLTEMKLDSGTLALAAKTKLTIR